MTDLTDVISKLHNKGVSPAGITSIILQLGFKPSDTNYQGVLKIVKNVITSIKSNPEPVKEAPPPYISKFLFERLELRSLFNKCRDKEEFINRVADIIGRLTAERDFAAEEVSRRECDIEELRNTVQELCS